MLGKLNLEVESVLPNLIFFSFINRTRCKVDSLHLGPLIAYPTSMSRLEENARNLQRLNEEEARIFREWHSLSEAERRDEGLAHELYCTLCGIPFWLSRGPHSYTSEGEEDCFLWVKYFFARK